eukprot:6739506-Pyramimonas_sp.AAC.1
MVFTTSDDTTPEWQSQSYVWDAPSAESTAATRRKFTPNTLTRTNTFGASIHDGRQAHGQGNATSGS